MMDHLEEAKQQLSCAERCSRQDWKQDYIQEAQAHALIALVERLDRLVAAIDNDNGAVRTIPLR